MAKQTRAEMVRAFAEHIPYNKELGIEILEIGPGTARMLLPWNERLIGNPEEGLLHGGCLTALLDVSAGLAVFMASEDDGFFATMDLRIDYMKPTVGGRNLVATAECYRMTKTVAFVRASACCEGDTDPVATATGTFIRHTLQGKARDAS